mmetsp:Transcript_4277/g.9235  ORF Transcript_4277/g.9235 Transcript_4277/m.9235 type:complete len:244 (-) Transcript_4277:942-1673(-)
MHAPLSCTRNYKRSFRNPFRLKIVECDFRKCCNLLRAGGTQHLYVLASRVPRDGERRAHRCRTPTHAAAHRWRRAEKASTHTAAAAPTNAPANAPAAAAAFKSELGSFAQTAADSRENRRGSPPRGSCKIQSAISGASGITKAFCGKPAACRSRPAACSHWTTLGIESVHVKLSTPQPSWYSLSTNFLTVAWSYLATKCETKAFTVTSAPAWLRTISAPPKMVEPLLVKSSAIKTVDLSGMRP